MNCDDGLRVSHYGPLTFAFNYGPETAALPDDKKYIIGSASISAGNAAVFLNDSRLS